MELAEIRVPEAMILSLLQCGEMSMTIDKMVDCEVDGCFTLYAVDSNMRCEVEITRLMSGPADQILQIIKEESEHGAASVHNSLSGLEMTGRPPGTPVTFLRVRVILHRA